MKKFLFLLLCLTIAVSATADVKTLRERRSEKRVRTERKVHQHQTPFQALASKNAGKKVAAPKDKSLRLVDEIPDGLYTMTYYREVGTAVYTDADHNLHSEPQDPDCTVTLALDEDGTVYMKNLLYKTNEVLDDYWVVGYFDFETSELRIPIGTTIAEFKDYDLYLDMGAIARDENNQVVYVPDPEPADDIVYWYDPEFNTFRLGFSKETPPYDGYNATGLCCRRSDNDAWEGFLEFETLLAFLPPEPPTVITEQPEGELVTYEHASYLVQNEGYPIFNNPLVDIVYAPDGETVYIKGLVEAGFEGWLRGTISDGKIHVPLGQYIYYDEDYYYGALISWGTSTLLGTDEYGISYFEFTPDPTADEFTFTIDGDNLIMDNTTGGNQGDGAIGLAMVWDDGDQFFEMEYNTVLTPFVEPELITDQPEGELKTYIRHGSFIWDEEVEQQDGEVYIVYAPDGETVYIQDIIAYSGMGTWVRGTIENGKIHVPTKQFIDWDYEYNYGIMLGFGQIVYNQVYGYYYFDYDPLVTEVTFTIDDDVISMDNTSLGPNDGIAGATGLASIWNDDPTYYLQCDVNTVFTLLPQIIYDQPEGTYRKYFRTLQPRGYHFRDEYYENGIAEFVFSQTDNTVYIKGITKYIDTWVIGTISDGKIHVPLGQYIYDDGNYYGKLRWLRATSSNGYDEQTEVDYSVTEVTFTIDGDKIIMDQDNYWGEPFNRQNGLGFCYYNSHGNLTDIRAMQLEIEFIPYFEPNVIEDMPEGELVTYLRRGVAIKHQYEPRGDNKGSYPELWPHELSQQDGETYVVYAPDGRTVYLFEPVQCYTNLHEPRYTWVMGTLSEDGHKIIVPLDQYVTWDPTANVAERLAWGTSGHRTDNYGQTEVYFVPDNSVMTVSYTIEDGCLRMDNSSGHNYVWEVSSNSWADNNTGLAITDQFMHWRGDLNWFTTYAGDHPAVPMDPVIEYWEDNGDENGNSALLTMIEATDVDGYGIEESGLSYTIYTDRGKPFTFEASKYGLQEDVTEVTYDMWQDNYMLRPNCIYFFRTNAEGFEPFFNWRIGIQLHYTCNGVKQSSNIVYLEVFDEPEDPVIPGDANGDGSVSIGDVTSIIDALLSNDLDVLNRLNADVNNDGFITIGDVTALIDMLLSSSGK